MGLFHLLVLWGWRKCGVGLGMVALLLLLPMVMRRDDDDNDAMRLLICHSGAASIYLHRERSR